MFDLNTLIPADSGRRLANATAINDAGQIAGWAQFPSAGNRSFLLTPKTAAPEPATCAVCTVALAGLTLLRRRECTKYLVPETTHEPCTSSFRSMIPPGPF